MVGQVEVRAGDTVHLKSTHSELNIIFEVLGVDRHVDQLQKDAEMTTVSSDAKNSCAGGRAADVSKLNQYIYDAYSRGVVSFNNRRVVQGPLRVIARVILM